MGGASLQIDPPRLVDEALVQDIVRRIVDRFNPRRIILFGSRARNNARHDSDLDLFVAMEANQPRSERRRLIDDLFERRWWSMDLLVTLRKKWRRGAAL